MSSATTESKTVTISVPVPAKEETVSVSASKQGATIQLGVAAIKLRRSEALAIADALVDCCEFYDEEKETQNG